MPRPTIRALVSDFNGVIVDDEALHYRAFAEFLDGEGLTLSRARYDSAYLGLDDWDFFQAALRDLRGDILSREDVTPLVERKGDIYMALIRDGATLCPGAEDLVRSLDGVVPMAIASGARRIEIEAVLAQAGMSGCFEAVVSADDMRAGKPDPEGYLLALGALRERIPTLSDLAAAECLVLEDAPHGIQAAQAAGMRCVGVVGSVDRASLAAADGVVDTLKGTSWSQLMALLG